HLQHTLLFHLHHSHTHTCRQTHTHPHILTITYTYTRNHTNTHTHTHTHTPPPTHTVKSPLMYFYSCSIQLNVTLLPRKLVFPSETHSPVRSSLPPSFIYNHC